jgi:hypothetical protein
MSRVGQDDSIGLTAQDACIQLDCAATCVQVKSELASDKLQGVPMARRTARSDSELREVLLETYAANDAMNQLLLAHLDPGAWRAGPVKKQPGRTHACGYNDARLGLALDVPYSTQRENKNS